MARLSLRAVSIYLSCIGLVTWTYYAVEGYYRVHFPNWIPETDWAFLNYETYFCTPEKEIHRNQINTFCIFQLLLYSILFVGVLKVHKQSLWICWFTLLILQLQRIITLFYSGCVFSLWVILNMIYSILEIWIVFRFAFMQEKIESLCEQSPTVQQQMSIREIQGHEIYNLNNLQTIPVASAPTLDNTNSFSDSCQHFLNTRDMQNNAYCNCNLNSVGTLSDVEDPVASAPTLTIGNSITGTISDAGDPVASAPTLPIGDSIPNSCLQNTEDFGSLTYNPPTYDESVCNADHLSIDLNSTDNPPLNTNVWLDTSTDLPPSYVEVRLG